MKRVRAHDRCSSASRKESRTKRLNCTLAVRFLLLSVLLFLAPAPAALVAQCLPSVTVTTASDSGAGSLRQAIADVCPGGAITFGDDMTITLASQLTIDKNLTINGVGYTVTVSGNQAVRVFWVNSGATFSLNQLTVTQGNVTGSTFDRPNSCGAGILNAGTVILTNVTLSDNSGQDLGGGLYNGEASSATLTNVTFSGNSALSGGAIFNLLSSATLTNVTFSGNSASSGGAMRNFESSATLTNVTFSGNTAGSGFCAMQSWGGNVIVRNSIMWGDTPGESAYVFNAPTFTDSVVQGGCPSGSTCTNIITGDPLLGALGAYGGSTQTIPLLPGSSAINAGNAAYCTIGTDQRGVSYVGACDVGAFESQGFTLTEAGGDDQHTPVNTAFGNPLSVTLTETSGPALPGAVITFTPPGSGASAVLSSGTATTDGSGNASVTATANGTAGGPYAVTASAAGGTPNVDFALTNDIGTATVVLSDLIQEYDGTPKSVTVTTNPVGLTYTVTYDGSPTPPTALGVYAVVATVTDPNYQGSGNGTLTIRDTTPPTVIVPAGITQEATGATGAVVTFTVTASDTVDGTLTPSCAPASGSTFPLGATTVTCAATDTAGNTGTGSFQVTVQDTTAPSVTISQATGQADPTGLIPVNFAVVFSEPVTDFATGDVTVSGTAGATTATVTEVAPTDGTTYNVAVSGMAMFGTVVITVDADVAHDAASNGNTASTNIDNAVTFQADQAAIPTMTQWGIIALMALMAAVSVYYLRRRSAI